MDLKEFLKPTAKKAIIFLASMGGLNYFWISGSGVYDGMILFGLPLGFWPKGSFMATYNIRPPPHVGFSVMNFSIDIIFWYLISCLIISAYNKLKPKI